jgi:hypothetical protein
MAEMPIILDFPIFFSNNSGQYQKGAIMARMPMPAAAAAMAAPAMMTDDAMVEDTAMTGRRHRDDGRD